MIIERLQFELTSNGRDKEIVKRLNELISVLCEDSEGWRWSLEVAWSSLLPTVKVDPAAAYRKARMRGKVHG